MGKRKSIKIYKPPPVEPKLVKVDLGCGAHKQEGFIGVDIAKIAGVDVVHDLKKMPWPFKANSIDEVYCSHFFEHLTGAERIKFMAELWRVLKPGAKAVMTTPHGQSVRAVQDPTHQWPPVVAESYLYFNKAWRDAPGNDIHYIENGSPIDFDFQYAESYDQVWGNKSQDARVFASRHYNNVAVDLIVSLVKRGLDEKKNA